MKISDVSALEELLDIGRYLGFCPWDYKRQKRPRTIYVVTLLLINLTVITNYVNLMRKMIFVAYTISEDKILVSINTLLTSYFQVEHIGRKNGWEKFFRIIQVLDQASDVRYVISLRRFRVKLLVYHVVTLLSIFVWTGLFLNVCSPGTILEKPHTVWLMVMLTTYKCLWLSLIMEQVTAMLSRRYLHVRKALMDRKDFRSLQYKGRLIFEAVGIVNEMFGTTIFWLLALAVIKGLYVFLMGTLMPMDSILLKMHYFTVICNCMETLIFALIILLGCDRVEKRHKDLLLTCNVLQPSQQDYVQREELILLTRYLENLPPRFTAAIFRLNREMISRFISILVRHFIVIVQFKRTRRA